MMGVWALSVWNGKPMETGDAANQGGGVLETEVGHVGLLRVKKK